MKIEEFTKITDCESTSISLTEKIKMADANDQSNFQSLNFLQIK